VTRVSDVAPLTEIFKYAGSLAVVIALFVGTWVSLSDQSSLPYRLWARYTSWLERKMRPMFIFVPGRHIAFAQLGAYALLALTVMSIEVPYWWLGIFLIGAAPAVWLEQKRKDRVLQIEEQLDNFVLALANALKSTPSIGAAFNTVVTVIQDPIRQEVDLAIKEMKVGSTLDQSLLHMASRVSSRPLDSALSAILIGRQVGGNLPRVLETTALTLREMRRLEGIIRTKTAEGKMQLWVIAALPFALLVGLNQLWPGYFAPLQTTFVGYIITFMCGSCWVSALVVARKVLAVDI
jgi:tight adherence protein B